MAATPVNIVERKHAVQYDGSNSADIDDAFPVNTISEAGGVWTFESPPSGPTYVVNTNDWIVFLQNMVYGTFSPGAFDLFFSCNAVCEDLDSAAVEELSEALDELEETVEALNTSPAVRSVGIAPVPLLLLGASTTVAVQLSPSMPDSSYTARAFKFAGVSLTDLNITSVTVVDADTVNVGVQNTGLVTLTGTSVLVTATA